MIFLKETTIIEADIDFLKKRCRLYYPKGKSAGYLE
jgi:hypothetical protein